MEVFYIGGWQRALFVHYRKCALRAGGAEWIGERLWRVAGQSGQVSQPRKRFGTSWGTGTWSPLAGGDGRSGPDLEGRERSVQVRRSPYRSEPATGVSGTVGGPAWTGNGRRDCARRRNGRWVRNGPGETESGQIRRRPYQSEPMGWRGWTGRDVRDDYQAPRFVDVDACGWRGRWELDR